MKIYIAGKITGLSDYKERFDNAEKFLRSKGHTCMNPTVLPQDFPYEAYMPICVAMINQCDAVYMLENWKDSKGAITEFNYAIATGKKIIYQKCYKVIECEKGKFNIKY